MNARSYAALIFALVLTACASAPTDDTIKSIEEQNIEIQRQAPENTGRGKAIESYREFLSKEGDVPLRAEAMRRLADLELERSEAAYLEQAKKLESDTKNEKVLKPADYAKAIEAYRELLRTNPNYVGNDQVLYQLARAYEQSGDYRKALRTLNQLARLYPNAKFIDEVQFRRGELFFVIESYPEAERAYRAVLKFGDTSIFYDRALYKHGWSQFKQSRYDSAIDSFFDLLDRKLLQTGSARSASAPKPPGESEISDDTFRVVSLSFSYLGGEKSIAKYFKKKGARPYEAAVYDNLGGLYLTQERYQDAANAFSEFIKQHENSRRAPSFQLKIIEAYGKAGFATLLVKAKEEFVARYGVGTDFWASYDANTQATIAPYLKSNTEDLARHFHAQAQRTGKAADYDLAARWYAEYVKQFPDDGRSPRMNFLLAEALAEGKRYREAAIQYEKTAYSYPTHSDSAEAGYAALLAHEKYEQQLRGRKRQEYQRRAIASALRFGNTFPGDKRAAAVLTNAAEELFALNQPGPAAKAARRVIAMKPQPRAVLRRTAWTVVAHVEFEKGAFGQAEAAYMAVLRLTPSGDARRPALVERLASSVYKQGEQQRANGDLRTAVAHFLRVKNLAPTSSVAPTAEYDAAAGLIALKDWRGAVKVLERFRTKYPDHPLQRDIPEKLAAAYLQGGQWGSAAAAFEEIARRRQDPQVRKEALWQAAELYEKGGRGDSAAAAYKQYIVLFPDPFERTMEARYRLAQLYAKDGRNTGYYYWLGKIVAAADAGGRAHTDRTQYLAAKASFLLAERAHRQFRSVRLVIPLQKSLKAKQRKMQVALKGYGRAADYGVAEFTTAATYRIAEVYQSLGRDLLASQRPRGLSPQELEQYDVLLEEQAYPFEEKAIEIYEINVRRVGDDIYDEWVRKSFEQLRKLRPVQYAKSEKSEQVSDAIR